MEKSLQVYLPLLLSTGFQISLTEPFTETSQPHNPSIDEFYVV